MEPRHTREAGRGSEAVAREVVRMAIFDVTHHVKAFKTVSLLALYLLVIVAVIGCRARARAPANWSIGIMEGESVFSLHDFDRCPNPRFSSYDVSTPRSSFVADPFLIHEGNLWLLFFELFNTDRDRGEIGLAVSQDLCHWSYQGVVLSEAFHLSFPYVFKEKGNYYMVPESKEAGEIRLYRATSFPSDWRFERTLVKGAYSDSTPILWQGSWYIFANRAPYTTRLFTAKDLFGPYSEHPKSPLHVYDSSLARPAGRPVVDEAGRLLRFVQDNREGYGKRVRVIEVKKLSQWEEQEVEAQSQPLLGEGPREWNSFGMHHVSPIRVKDRGWIAAVDGNAREEKR